MNSASSAVLPPLPGHDLGDDSDWMNALGHCWHAVPAWGRDCWDLLEWLFAVVAHVDGEGLHGLATYEEGDVDVQPFPSCDECDAVTDRVAISYWRTNGSGPRDLPDSDGDVLPHHGGPFSCERAEREGRA